MIIVNFILYLEMCTGDFVDSKMQIMADNGKARPPKGTKCESSCKFESGRWGSSFCEVAGNNWGAECVPCPTSK